MRKLKPNEQKTLKLFHIVFTLLWIGGGMMPFKFFNPQSGGELYGICLTYKFIDLILTICCIGILFTSVVFSIWTEWGWFKHKWITVKWVILLITMVLGTLMDYWLTEIEVIIKEQGLKALSNPVFLHNKNMYQAFGIIQVSMLLYAAFLSVFKLWKHKKKSYPNLKEVAV